MGRAPRDADTKEEKLRVALAGAPLARGRALREADATTELLRVTLTVGAPRDADTKEEKLRVALAGAPPGRAPREADDTTDMLPVARPLGSRFNLPAELVGVALAVAMVPRVAETTAKLPDLILSVVIPRDSAATAFLPWLGAMAAPTAGIVPFERLAVEVCRAAFTTLLVTSDCGRLEIPDEPRGVSLRDTRSV